MAHSTPFFSWVQPDIGADFNVWGTVQNALTTSVDADLWAVKLTADAAIQPAGGVFTGPIEIFQALQQPTDMGNMSGAVTLDLAVGEVFYGVMTGVINPINVIGWTAGKYQMCVLEVENGGQFNWVFNSAIVWNGGIDPSDNFNLSPGVDTIIFTSRDGGVKIRAHHNYGAPS